MHNTSDFSKKFFLKQLRLRVPFSAAQFTKRKVAGPGGPGHLLACAHVHCDCTYMCRRFGLQCFHCVCL